MTAIEPCSLLPPRRSRRIGVGLLAILALTVAGCDDRAPTQTQGGETEDPVLEVVLSPAPESLIPGETTTLSASVRRRSGIDPTTSVAWTSSDPAVVEIGTDGTATAGDPGTTVIRAAAGGTFSEVALSVVAYRASDDAVVIPPTQAPMVSTTEDRARGVLKFVPGTGPVPTLPTGSVVVGDADGGYLARVVSSELRDDTLVVATEPAALNEVVEYGGFAVRFPFDGPVQAPSQGEDGAVGWGETVTEFRAPGVNALASSPGEVVLDDLDLCDLFDDAEADDGSDDDETPTVACPDFLEVSLKNGRILYNPTVSFEASFDGFDLDEAEAKAEGSLAFDIDLEATATQDFEFESERELLRRSKTFYALIGSIPVGGIARISLHAGVKAEAEVSASAKTGFTSFSSLTLGLSYDKDDVTENANGWDPTASLSSDFVQRSTHWGGSGEAKVRAWIRPELEILLYAVAGPSVSMTPWIEGSGEIELNGSNPESSTCAYDVKAAVDTQLKARVTFLDKNLAEWKHDEAGSVRTLVDEECTFGSVTVQTATSGRELDPDGYRAWLDVERKDIGVNDEASFGIVPTGTQSVLLTGLAENCIVLGDNPRSVTVAPFEEAIVGFPVNCTSTTGKVSVGVTTTGTGAKPESYTVTVDGGALSKPISTNGSVSFDQLAAGLHAVRLADVPSNCAVDEGALRNVSLLSGQTEQVDFEVECSGGGLRVSVVTTGEELDPDGYEVQVDDGAPKHIPAYGSVEFPGALPGARQVRFSGLEDNCQLLQDNPSTVNVNGLTLTRAEFEVRCTEGRVADENITIRTQAEADALDALTIINGHLSVFSSDEDPITDLSKLRRLIRVDGRISIARTELTDLNDFENLISADGLTLVDNDRLTTLSGLRKLETLGTVLNVSQNDVLTTLSGLSGVTTTGRNGEPISIFISSNASLASLSGLEFVDEVGTIQLYQNPLLTSVQALRNIEAVGGALLIIGNSTLATLTGLDGITSVSNSFRIENNSALTSLSPMQRLESVGGQFQIIDNDALTTTSGLSALATVGENLWITDNAALQQVVGLTALTRVGGGLWVADNPSLLTISGLGAPETVFGDMVAVSNNAALLDLVGLKGSEAGGVSVQTNAHLEEANFSIPTIHGGFSVSNNARLRTLGFDVDRVGGEINIGDNGSISPMQNLQGMSGISVGRWVYIQYNRIESLSGLSGLDFDDDRDDLYIRISNNSGVCNSDALVAAQASGAPAWQVHSNTCGQ